MELQSVKTLLLTRLLACKVVVMAQRSTGVITTTTGTQRNNEMQMVFIYICTIFILFFSSTYSIYNIIVNKYIVGHYYTGYIKTRTRTHTHYY